MVDYRKSETMPRPALVTERRHRRGKMLRRYGFLLLLLPGLLFYAALILYPFLTGVIYGFYDWNGIGPLNHFIGLANYLFVLHSGAFSIFFYRALLHNLELFAMTMVLTTLVGMLVAYLMTRVSERASRIFQVIYFLPHVVPAVVVAFMLSFYVQPTFGVIPALATKTHMKFLDQPYLGSGTLALPTIAVVSSWASIGFATLIFLAAMVGLPRDVLEAARVDGAGAIQLFGRVVFPMIRPTFVTVMTLAFINSFGTFDLIYVLEGTQAGPDYATDVTGTLFYRTAFGGFGTTAQNMGLAAALAVVSFVIVIIVSGILVRLQRRWAVQY